MSFYNSFKQRRGDMSLILILLLLLIIILLILWYAFWGKPKAMAPAASQTPTPSATATPIADPYAGWKSFTLKYEKITFKYPATWTLTDSSTVGQDAYDSVSVKSPDGFAISMRTGVWGIGGSCEDCKAYETTTATILGAKTGISIFGGAKGAQGIGLMRADSGGTTTYECIGLCTLPGKNTLASLNDNKPGLMMFTGGYPLSQADAIKLGTSDKTFTYDVLKADPNIATARLIFASLSY